MECTGSRLVCASTRAWCARMTVHTIVKNRNHNGTIAIDVQK